MQEDSKLKKLKCVNCNSTDCKIAYSRKKEKWFIRCMSCNWIQKYLEMEELEKMQNLQNKINQRLWSL